VTQRPYLDWRLENPGGVEVSWEPEATAKGLDGDGAGQLCRLVMDASNYPCKWATEKLLQMLALGGGGDGQGR